MLVSSQMEITEEAVTWLHIVAGCSLKSLLCHGIETVENRRGVPRLFSVLLGSMECLAQPDWKRTSRHNMLRMLRLAITRHYIVVVAFASSTKTSPTASGSSRMISPTAGRVIRPA